MLSLIELPLALASLALPAPTTVNAEAAPPCGRQTVGAVSDCCVHGANWAAQAPMPITRRDDRQDDTSYERMAHHVEGH